jgi:HlyD family secretion protein
MTNDSPRKNSKLGKNVLKWVKRALMVLFVLGVVAMLVVAWMPKPIPVDVAEAERGAFRVTVDEDGRTRVKDRYVVGAPVMGNLARTELDPGDTVEEGAVLARILSLEPPLMDARSRAQAEARVEQARAATRQSRATMERVEQAAAFAQREAARQRQLAQRGSVAELAAERAELEARTSQEELASTRFAVRVAEYELRVAEETLARPGAGAGQDEQVMVTAPVAGKVLRVIQENEGPIQAGMPLVELGNPAALEIVVDVLTSDAVHIEHGARVIIERWGRDTPLTGRVRVVEPSAFTRLSALGVEEQRVNVVIDIEEPYEVWKSLGDGYRVEARIVVWEADDVLYVPASAVFRHGEGWAVYRVKDEKAVLTEIETGHRNGLEVEVTGGLDAGEQIVLHPSDQVTDGIAIEAR